MGFDRFADRPTDFLLHFRSNPSSGIRKPLKYFIDLWIIENVMIGALAFEAAPIKILVQRKSVSREDIKKPKF
jgi:hypothetical protein